jgi:hypothetical protein
MDFPEIKKRVKDFLVSEKGSISKQALIKLGTLAAVTSFATLTVEQVRAADNWGKCELPLREGFDIVPDSAAFKSTTNSTWYPGIYLQGQIDNPPTDNCDDPSFLREDRGKTYSCVAWGHKNELGLISELNGELRVKHTHSVEETATTAHRMTAPASSSGGVCELSASQM